LNMPQLQRLALPCMSLYANAIRALQPGLRSNRNLKELWLSNCSIRNEGLGLLVDALVGNTTMEILDISYNYITPNGLGELARLVKFTELKKMHSEGNIHLFDDLDAMKNFISVLHKHTILEEFTIEFYDYPQQKETVMAIDIILARNRSLKRANALLALQPRTGLPIGSKSGIWYMAMFKMGRFHNADMDDDEDDDHAEGSDNGPDYAAAPTYPGASAIFKIFQARPAILEYQLPRPSAAAVAAASTIQFHERDSRSKRCRIL
jgi:Leucine Rich repeat